MNIAVWCCGGAGTNIGKQFPDLNADVYYLDTSTSNLKGVAQESVFLLEGIDGAGKDRAKTYKHFVDQNVAQDILIRFQASTTLNVVISSLGGGSGSVCGPLLTKELLSRGLPTIAIVVDSDQSIKELDNSIKTLQTFKSISDVTKRCVSLYYIRNSDRRESDNSAIYFMSLLSLLVDKKRTEEFDNSDLLSFLEFSRVTDNDPSVGLLQVSANEPINPLKNTTVVSSILATTDRQSSIKPVTPEYLSTCIITDPNFNEEDIRIDNVLGMLAVVTDSLSARLEELRQNKKLNRFKEIEVSGSLDDGMVL